MGRKFIVEEVEEGMGIWGVIIIVMFIVAYFYQK